MGTLGKGGGSVVIKGGLFTCGCSFGVHGLYVDMALCPIFWLSSSIFVCSEVVSASLA